MKINLTNVLFFILITLNSFAQQDPILIRGLVNSDQKPISDIHIINLKNYYGTISNDNGEFEIIVNVNDTLLFSSIEFEQKKIKITDNHIKLGKIIVTLVPAITNLKEIFLKGLTGNLIYDSKNIAEKTPEHNFKFNKSDLSKKLSEDIHGPKSAPFVGPFKPLPATAVIPNFAYEKEQHLKREIAKKIQFPIKIRRELGIKFFTIELKIPEDKIDHFIAYCECKDIIDLYYHNKILDVIRIFKEESISYHELTE